MCLGALGREMLWLLPDLFRKYVLTSTFKCIFIWGVIEEVAEFHRQHSPALSFNDVNLRAISLPLHLEVHDWIPLQTKLIQSTDEF